MLMTPKKAITMLVTLAAIFLLTGTSIASDVTKGIPGLKWGDLVKNAKGYRLQHCGEISARGDPSFYTILSPEDFKMVGLSSKTHKAWTPPILWTYNNRLLGVQFDLADTNNAVTALLKELGEPTKKRSNNTTYGICEWKIKNSVLIKALDLRKMGYTVQIYHIPTLKKLNDARKKLGMEAWE